MKRTESTTFKTRKLTARSQLHIQLARASQACMLAFERVTGIHPTKWQVLAFLSQNGKSTQKVLSQAIMIDGGALTRLLKQLEVNGWIMRAPHPSDNRLTDVELTSAGRSFILRCSKLRAEFVEQAMAGIDDVQSDLLIAALQRIQTNLSR